MPTFDIVSEVDGHEVSNAIDQANREISNRFDFKGTNSRIEQQDLDLVIHAPGEFQINQIKDILVNKITKRNIDPACLEYAQITQSGNEARMPVSVRHGIDKELAKTLVKDIKAMKLKVQTAIQGEQVRVSGKKKDELQSVISALRDRNYPVPLQYINFRD